MYLICPDCTKYKLCLPCAQKRISETTWVCSYSKECSRFIFISFAPKFEHENIKAFDHVEDPLAFVMLIFGISDPEAGAKILNDARENAVIRGPQNKEA